MFISASESEARGVVRRRRAATGLTAGVTASAALAASVLGTGPASAAGDADGPSKAGTVRTPFALEGLAFGTQARGQTVPVQSSQTALVVLKCTKDAGIDRSRGVANDDLVGLGQASGIATRTWTTSKQGVVTSHARSKIGDLTVANVAGGLTVEALVVTTRTWHDDEGYHRAHGFRLAGLSGEVGGVPIELPAPADIDPGQTISIPGILRATFDERSGTVTRRGAQATSTGLVIELADGSKVSAGRAQTAISGGVVGGLLGGRAQSVRGSGLVETKNVVKKSVSCRGTDGEWRNEAAAAFTQPGLEVGATTVGAFGDQLGQGEAVVRTRARSARVEIGDEQIVVTAIRAQSNVVRDGDRYTRTSDGTHLGSLTVNGQERPLPSPGESLVVPGVARITPGVVARTSQGITVVGLRIELLEGGEIVETLDIAKTNAHIDNR